jgi:hypothetical protein
MTASARQKIHRSSKRLRELFQRAGAYRTFMKTPEIYGIIDRLNGLADSLRIPCMPDFQGAKNRIPERLNLPLLFALLFALSLAFKLALFPESVGECHGFMFERLDANPADALL